MKSYLYIAIVAAALLFGVGFGYWRGGESASGAKLGFVTAEKLFADFEMRKELHSKFEILKQNHKQRLDSLKVEVEAAALTYQKNASEPTAKNARWAQQTFLRIEQEFLEEENRLNQSFTEQIWKQLNQYVADYGKANGYRFIFGANGTGSLMYASDGDDLTETMVKYANQKYKGEAR